MPLSSWKIICLAGIGMLAIGCSNQNPVTMDSKSSENSAATRSVTQTYMSAVPTSNYGVPASMAASLQFPGNLEMVRSTSGGLEHLWWHLSQPPMTQWANNGIFNSNVHSPALCVSNYDKLLQVVGLDINNPGRLHHLWRDWWGGWHDGGVVFSSNCYGPPALISNRHPSLTKNLEVVVRTGEHLKHIWRDENYVWQGETHFAYESRVYGDPQLVQTNDYNFHVIAPIMVNNGSSYQMGHWKRVNLQWYYMGSFGDLGDGRIKSGAIAINYSNNTLEAFVPYFAPLDYHITIWRYNGSQWVYDGLVQNPGYNICATTRNSNEIHIAMDGNYVHEHWKVMQQ